MLKLVIAFLKDRRMLVQFDGKSSTEKNLPGGGPQGTVLALILFLVLINDLGFPDQVNNVGEIITSTKKAKVESKIHLKYVDDFSAAESINLKKNLICDPSQPMPVPYHCRTGHVLPKENSKVYHLLQETKAYADTNLMKINFEKTSLMVFNPCKSVDFLPQFEIDNQTLNVVEENGCLGLILQSDLKWTANTRNIVK